MPTGINSAHTDNLDGFLLLVQKNILHFEVSANTQRKSAAFDTSVFNTCSLDNTHNTHMK